MNAWLKAVVAVGMLTCAVARAADNAGPEAAAGDDKDIVSSEKDLPATAANISVEMKHASMQEMARVLSDATGAGLRSWPPNENGQGGEGYTLSVKDKPFWEVITLLSAQRPLAIRNINGGAAFQEESPGLSRFVPANNGFVIFPGTVTRSKNYDLQTASPEDGANEQISVSYTVAWDPRVWVVRASQGLISEAVDDAGNDLLAGQTSAPREYMQDSRGLPLSQENTSFLVPEKIGKKIVSIKGEKHFVVATSESIVEISNPAKHLNTPITVGARQMTITRMELRDNNYLNFQFQMPGNRVQRANRMPVRVQVLMGDRVVWDQMIYGNYNSGVNTSGDRGALKVRMMTPTNVDDVMVEYEIKDLTVPAR